MLHAPGTDGDFSVAGAGSPAPRSSVNPFRDINSGAYYYQAVLWAVEQGITSGTSSTTFSPDAIITRGQTVMFLYRNAGSPASGTGNAFDDVKIGDTIRQRSVGLWQMGLPVEPVPLRSLHRLLAPVRRL